MTNNDYEASNLETLDRDLGRLSNLEMATAYVSRPLIGLGISLCLYRTGQPDGGTVFRPVQQCGDCDRRCRNRRLHGAEILARMMSPITWDLRWVRTR